MVKIPKLGDFQSADLYWVNFFNILRLLLSILLLLFGFSVVIAEIAQLGARGNPQSSYECG